MASFDKRVKQIASAEKDVDKVLKAARLKRIENGETTGQTAFKIIIALCVTAITIVGIVFYGVPFILIASLIYPVLMVLITLINGGL